MRNIPDFTCEYGAAQLILENIDYSRKAYCLVLWVVEGQMVSLLTECARFCTMVGAEKTYALLPQNYAVEEDFPYAVAFRVVEMTAPKTAFAETDCALWPVLPENAGDYLERHNMAMMQVDGARRLREKEIPRLLDRGGCYFVHRHGQVLGLGQVEEDRILSLAALIPGAGAAVVGTLASLIPGDMVRLSVADSNTRATGLYQRMGFTATKILEVWWEIGRNR